MKRLLLISVILALFLTSCSRLGQSDYLIEYNNYVDLCNEQIDKITKLIQTANAVNDDERASREERISMLTSTLNTLKYEHKIYESRLAEFEDYLDENEEPLNKILSKRDVDVNTMIRDLKEQNIFIKTQIENIQTNIISLSNT